MDTIGIFGGAFNPPGTHHSRIAQRLTDYFNRVIVVPCAYRTDKTTTAEIGYNHRRDLVEIAFGNIAGIEIDFFDLDHQEFTPTWKLQERYQDEGHLCHIVGSDLVKVGTDGNCEIQRSWEQGERVWRTFNFGIVLRGEPIVAHTLPPNSTILFEESRDSSTGIRNRLKSNLQINGLLDPQVLEYIRLRNLYHHRPEGVVP